MAGDARSDGRIGGFRRYLWWLIAPTLVLTGVALHGILRQVSAEVARSAEECRLKTVTMADELRDTIRDDASSPAERHVRLAAILSAQPGDPESLAAAVPPVGGFTWSAKSGLQWEMGIPESVRQVLAGRRYWKEWASGQSSRTPRRGLEELALPSGAFHVLWGRVDNEIYGLVFSSPPVVVRSSAGFWVMLAAAVVLAALMVVMASVCLWRAAERERHADEQKTRFISDVSHELKTPLATIGLWMDMLSGGRLADESRRQHVLEVITEENARMARMVTTLLEYTRLEQKARKYAMEDFDLSEVVHDMATVLQNEFKEHGLTVSAASGCRVRADRDAVKGILGNLLVNAAKYAADGGPVEVTAAHAGAKVALKVLDRGPGLSEADRTKVFTRFYRAKGRNTAAKGGFGLGLPISWRLARDMGGDLTVAARDGGGCVFTLELNAAEASGPSA